ncbi:unnamed protein product [Adineta steineri]|uniref:Uncharacterized protein n=1 Tax=Adineta steineri TaxID=433720 RepID=A0A815VRK5_9BILA|nr:unnamed protein product [Adineta steineri]CAF1655401.1 unnamed protein product [Adineta steineri]
MLKISEISYPKSFHCCTAGTLWTILENSTYLEAEEFAAPGAYGQLRCKGRPCAKCHKCRDWHFSGNQDQWNLVCNWENWKKVDEDRWNYEGLQLFTKRDGATCNVADADRHFNTQRGKVNDNPDRNPDPDPAPDRHFNTQRGEVNDSPDRNPDPDPAPDRHFNTQRGEVNDSPDPDPAPDRHFNTAHLCLCEKH